MRATLGMPLFVASCLLVSGSLTHADIVYVSCNTNNTIERIDSNGNVSVFADANSGLSTPLGLALDGNGNLYVANSGNNTIMKFDPSGHGSVFVSSGLAGPDSLAFDVNGNLYALNAISGGIEEFNSSGEGNQIAANGISANGLAFDASGKLYAANSDFSGSVNVHTFDSNGNGTLFFRLLQQPSIPVPGGLAFDKNGNLYLAIDHFGYNYGQPDMIERISASGVGSVFAGAGLANPRDLAFGTSGDLYVANNGFVEEIGSNGNESVFASGLPLLQGIAVGVPEPMTLALVVLGVAATFPWRRRVPLRVTV